MIRRAQREKLAGKIIGAVYAKAGDVQNKGGPNWSSIAMVKEAIHVADAVIAAGEVNP
jgi:hypothetical protein